MPGCVAAWLSERQLSCYQLIGAHLLDAGQCHPVYVPARQRRHGHGERPPRRRSEWCLRTCRQLGAVAEVPCRRTAAFQQLAHQPEIVIFIVGGGAMVRNAVASMARVTKDR